MFDFSNYSAQFKYYGNSNKLVFGKVTNEIRGVTFKKLFNGLKPKMYSFLVDDSLIFGLIRTAFLSIYKSIIFALVRTAFLLLDCI